MGQFGKTPGLQIFMRLGYRGSRFFGVAPQREGVCVLDAVRARLRLGGIVQVPYAINFAARTDRHVDASENWLSFRVRLLPGDNNAERLGTAVVAALQDNSVDDGLEHVLAQQVPHRIMARSYVRAKHYRYALSAVVGSPQSARALQVSVLQQAAAQLTGLVHVGRLAHPSAARACNTQLWRPMLVRVTAQQTEESGCTVDIFGTGFLRRQVRYVVGALQTVMAGAWTCHDVAHWARGHLGPPRPGYLGPAAPEGLTLAALLPHAAASALLQETLPPPMTRAAFTKWLSVPFAP